MLLDVVPAGDSSHGPILGAILLTLTLHFMGLGWPLTGPHQYDRILYLHQIVLKTIDHELDECRASCLYGAALQLAEKYGDRRYLDFVSQQASFVYSKKAYRVNPNFQNSVRKFCRSGDAVKLYYAILEEFGQAFLDESLRSAQAA
jgi:hypothetical protein